MSLFDEITINQFVTQYRNLGKVSRKSGPKQREWAELDEKLFPKVKETVDRICSPYGKPDRVFMARIEREVGAPSKQFEKLPRCAEYVESHTETQNEYRARQVTWAVKLAVSEGSGVSLWGKLKSGIGWLSLDFCRRFLN